MRFVKRLGGQKMLGHDAGNRVTETVTSGGTSTTSFYLTDQANPTGYAQPVEVWTSTDDNRSDASLQETYILGDRVLAQADSSGTLSYLLTDGHGSTQQMTDASGNVTATFNYDAFGTALNFDASHPPTVFLFGGDAVYDPASGLYMHGDGVRDRQGFLFMQRDSADGESNDPISIHKYLYANAQPTNMTDPTGHASLGASLLVDAIIGAVGVGFALGATGALATAGLITAGGAGIVLLIIGGLWLTGTGGFGFFHNGSPIPSSDTRIPAAAALLQRFSTAEHIPSAAAAASFMYAQVTANQPTVLGNPRYDDRGETDMLQPGLFSRIQVPMRVTVISTGRALNASDIAVELYGEYQRQQQPVNTLDKVMTFNRELNIFQGWLRKIQAPTNHDWNHP